MKENIFKIFKKSIFSKLIIVALSFINTIIINRFLGVSLRGEYTVILNMANLIQLILNLGIGSAFPNFSRAKKKNCKEIFSSIIIIQFAIYSVIFVFINLFLKDKNSEYIMFIALVSILNNHILYISMIEDIIKRNKILLFSSISYTFSLIFVLICFDGNLEIIINIILLKYILENILLIYKFNIYKINIKLITKLELKEISKIAIPSMLMTLLMTCNYNLDILILNYLTKNTYVVGLYGTAVTLGNMLWIIPDAFKEVLFNRTTKKDCIDEIIISIIVNIFICIIIIIGFTVLGKWFLGIFYGYEYIQSYNLVLILFCGTLPMIMYKLIHPLYIVNGKPMVVVKILFISVIMNIILNFISIKKWGATGAAFSSLISYSICGFFFLFRFCKDYNVSRSQLINLMKKIIFKLSNKSKERKFEQ